MICYTCGFAFERRYYGDRGEVVQGAVAGRQNAAEEGKWTEETRRGATGIRSDMGETPATGAEKRKAARKIVEAPVRCRSASIARDQIHTDARAL